MDNMTPYELVRQVGRRAKKCVKSPDVEFIRPTIVHRRDGDYYYAFEVRVPDDEKPVHLTRLGDAHNRLAHDPEMELNRSRPRHPSVKAWEEKMKPVTEAMVMALTKEFGEPKKVHPNGAVNWHVDGALVVCRGGLYPGVEVHVHVTRTETVKPVE